MPLRFQDLTTTQLQTLPRSQTVFFMPVGPLEDHGPHLPLGLDALCAQKVSEQTANLIEKSMPGWSAILLPTLPLGIEGNTQKNKIFVRAHVLRDWLVDACLSLNKEGFKYFICITGHSGPKQLTAIEDAGKIVRRKSFLKFGQKPLLLSGSSALVSKTKWIQSPFYLKPTEHGGRLDTSLALEVCPNLVQPQYTGLAPKDPPAFGLLTKNSGYWGNPSEANRELGQTTIQTQSKELFEKIRPILEGVPPRSQFRTWYSVLPPNWSFFYAWVLFFALATLLSIWFYMSFRGFLF